MTAVETGRQKTSGEKQEKMRVCVADFLRALHWPSFTLPPLASQMDNSEEKTCFVPVYFIKGPKVGPLAGSRDVDTPTDLVLLTVFFAQHR